MLLNKPIKILILASYWNRPVLVRSALESVLRAGADYPRWHLAFGDDGSDFPGEPVVREVMADHLDKVSFYNTNMTVEEKVEKGIKIGRLANQALAYTDCQVWITLCDDDYLHPDYFHNLNRYFAKHKRSVWCHSKIYTYDPVDGSEPTLENRYNQWSGPVEPYGRLDGSQVAFRVSLAHEAGIWYRDTTLGSDPEHPWSYNLDGELFKTVFRRFGPCPETGFVSQYKGVHRYQLVQQKEHVWRSKEDIMVFHEDVLRKAGKEF